MSSSVDLLPAFTDEQLREWASHRCDDAGRLARALLAERRESRHLAARQCETPMADDYGHMVCVKMNDLATKLAAAEQRACPPDHAMLIEACFNLTVRAEKAEARLIPEEERRKLTGDALAAEAARDLAERQNDLLHKENAKLRGALVGCIDQYAYEGTKDGKPVIHSGGLSTLEEALDVLGLSDPCPKEAFDALAETASSEKRDGE